MGVAATFSRKTGEDNGLVIGREDRALGIDVSLQPFVNIDRDLKFGRGYNTFGEDPFLTSEMGVAEVNGIQSQDVMAQIKHYVTYDTEGTNVWVDGKTTYSVGVFVGYRWFDKENIDPLFPFGHGLGYTTFAYSGLSTAKASDG